MQVLRRFGPGDSALGVRWYLALPLLDSAAGGTGQTLAIESVALALKSDDNLRIILAGGLTPNNVVSVLGQLKDHSHQIIGVDVSSGVEENGKQSADKIEKFVNEVKSGGEQ